jgi:hypothetical protein
MPLLDLMLLPVLVPLSRAHSPTIYLPVRWAALRDNCPKEEVPRHPARGRTGVPLSFVGNSLGGGVDGTGKARVTSREPRTPGSSSDPGGAPPSTNDAFIDQPFFSPHFLRSLALSHPSQLPPPPIVVGRSPQVRTVQL